MHLLEAVAVGKDCVAPRQHDDAAGLGQHGQLYGQVSHFLLLVGTGKYNILLLDILHGILLGLAA